MEKAVAMRIEFGSRTKLLVIVALSVVTAASLLSARRLGAGPSEGIRTALPANAAGQWVSLGPVPFTPQAGAANYQSGRIAAIAVDPRDESHWLVGVGNGGVWETRDAGGSWSPMIDDVPTLAIGAVAFAPGNPEIIYIGTGESAGGASFAHVGIGILKSTNGGRSWALSGESSFSRGSIRRLHVDPNDPNVVMAASSRGGFGRDAGVVPPAPPPAGVLKSVDGGTSWTRTLAGQATALEVDPRSFSRQYAAIADQRVGVRLSSDSTDQAAVTNGVYRSTDGGVSWSRIEGPWGTEASTTRSTVGRIELVLAPSDPNVAYASIQVPPNGGTNATGLLGLFRTDNAWADSPAWVQIPTDATGPGGYCGPSKCGYSHVISVDPRNANTLFAGGAEQGFWRCANCSGSPTWTNTTANAGVHPDHHALAWAGNRLIDGTDGGVWSSTDLGATWQNHNRTLPTTMFYQGALHPTDSSFALGGPRDFTVSVYRAAVGWRILPQASASEWGEAEVAISSSRPDTDWMASWLRGVIQRTTDGGRTTLRVDDSIDKVEAAFVAPVRKCPANDDVFLTGTNRVWKTTNFFNSSRPSWTVITPALQFPARGFNALNDPNAILTIVFVESDRACNSFAYGTRGGEVRLTRDGGTTWNDLDPSKSLPARPVNSVAFDPTNSNRVFVALSSFNEATPAKPGHIFRTDNASSATPTWTRVGPPDVPFANMPFNVIAIDPRNSQLVYAGSDNGLWQSEDGGATWTKVGLASGLPPASVYDIQINPTTNRTVIFTYGRGAFELSR
jgi:photosystem II stability/assembly factor-like uncharacterized protein